MVQSRFQSSSYSVMGDEDRTEFQFANPLDDNELLEMLERNPRISMLCDWMTAIALKNGFNLPSGSEAHLEKIHFMEKLHRLIMFDRLHGAAMARLFDKIVDDIKDADGDVIETTKTTNFEVYHKIAGTVGWFLKSSDIGENGQPKSFHLTVNIEEGKVATKIVQASEVVIFKNPKKRERWDGTPSSKLIAHTALLEEMLLKITGKHAIDVAGSFLHFDGIQSTEQAAAIHASFEDRPISELYTNGVTITPMMNEVKGAIGELKIFSDMLKDFMASGMRVSRQAMDGAAEGTLSSAEYNTIMTSDTIEAIQSHHTPYIIDLLALLGYPDHKLVWNKPIEKLDSDNKEKPQDEDSEDKDVSNEKEEE